MVSCKDIQEFLTECGVVPGCNSIELDKYVKLIDAAKSKFGDDVSASLMDFFMPEGEPIEPGYEDSLSHYQFTCNTWDEFEQEWERQ